MVPAQPEVQGTLVLPVDTTQSSAINATNDESRFVFALGLAAQTPSGPARDAPASGAPNVSSMRAHLFQNKSGQLSQDILDPKYGGSWNAIAGPNASDATLVVVEVSGSPGGTYTGFFGPKTKYAVRLVAREGGRRPKLLLDATRAIPVLNDDGKVYVAFFLNQGGCAPVRLTATTVGVGAGKPLERSLNFACGE